MYQSKSITIVKLWRPFTW